MISLYTTHFDAGVAQSTLRATARTPVHFGSDISCTDDATPTFTELEEDDPTLVAECAWRAITSPRGSIPGAPDRGFDVRSLLRAPATQTEIRTWPSRVRSEIMKDERVQTCTVEFAQTAVDAWEITIRGETETGPFGLVGALTSGSAILKEILGT